MLSRHTLRSCNCGNAKFWRAIIPAFLNYLRSQKKRALRRFWIKLILRIKYQTICNTSLTNSSATSPTRAIILSIDPFHVDIDVLPDTLQEQALEIKNDSAAQYDFEKMDKAQFWVKYLKVYPSTAEQALKLFLPFSSTYLCEKAFSAVVAIKTKYRSKLDIASDLRCALSSIEPRIGNLVKNMQAHPSH